MRTSCLTVVTFDFWATLVRDSPQGLAQQRAMRLGALAEVLAQSGHGRPASAVEAAYERCGLEMSERAWSAHRDLDIREQVRLFFECLEAGLADRLSAEAFRTAVEGYTTPVLHAPPALVPGATEVIRGLAARGLRLGIISNTGRTPGSVLRQLLERHDLLRWFRVTSYSDEVGLRKPHAGIFDRTLRLLEVSPQEALHVGDNPYDDVVGARGVGMLAAHFAPDGAAPSADAEVVITDLRELPGRLDAIGPRSR